jgi:hypothetical protein
MSTVASIAFRDQRRKARSTGRSERVVHFSRLIVGHAPEWNVSTATDPRGQAMIRIAEEPESCATWAESK